MKTIICPSILGYEQNLIESKEAINEILSAGINSIHIDIMREPFITGKTAFSEQQLEWIHKEFSQKTGFDFHLMVSNPRKLIEAIKKIIPFEERKKNCIAIHREAFRDYEEMKKNSLEKYSGKEFDLTESSTGSPELDSKLKKIDSEFAKRVFKELRKIKKAGFMAGIALEPKTSLKSIAGMKSQIDKILIMSVSSGAGGQSFIPETESKIKKTRSEFEKIEIQVDGGINSETIPIAVKAGANNLVIGSCITKEQKPSEKIKIIQKQINYLYCKKPRHLNI